jgi:hypothetical protein
MANRAGIEVPEDSNQDGISASVIRTSNTSFGIHCPKQLYSIYKMANPPELPTYTAATSVENSQAWR